LIPTLRNFLANILGRARQEAATPAPERTSADADRLPSTVAGSQKSRDTEQRAFLVPTGFIPHPYDLQTYLNLYESDSLSKAIVDADTNLTISNFLFECESDGLNQYLRDFHQRFEMNLLAWQLYRDISAFGFGVFELIGDAATFSESEKLIAWKRLDPRFVFIQKSFPLGRIKIILQRPTNQIVPGLPQPPFGIALDPATILFANSISPSSIYGLSILQPLIERINERRDLIAATVKAHRKFANAVDWLQYLADPARPNIGDECAAQLKALKDATDRIDEETIRFLLSAGSGEYKYTRIGADELPDATPLLNELTRDVVTSAGFSASMFGLSGAQDLESSRYTTNSIITRQRNLMAQINLGLYSLLPFIEKDCPAESADEIIVSMEAPTQETIKEQLEAEAIRINNVVLKVRQGLISEDKGAQELGYANWHDPDKLNESAMQETNPSDPNAIQQTRASIKSLNKGTPPRNNPSGQKGE
jgi:hypothetical protein